MDHSRPSVCVSLSALKILAKYDNKKIFCCRKAGKFWFRFNVLLLVLCNDKLPNSDSVNGLAPSRWVAVIWTKDVWVTPERHFSAKCACINWIFGAVKSVWLIVVFPNWDHITVLISLILPSIKTSNGDADAFPLQMAPLMWGMWDWCADSSSCVWLSRMPIGLEFYGTISGCIDRTIHWTDLWFWQGRQSYCELRHPHLSPNLAPSDG